LSKVSKYKGKYLCICGPGQELAKGRTVRGSNPGDGGEIFGIRPEGPWRVPSLLYNGYRVITGGSSRGVALITHAI